MRALHVTGKACFCRVIMGFFSGRLMSDDALAVSERYENKAAIDPTIRIGVALLASVQNIRPDKGLLKKGATSRKAERIWIITLPYVMLFVSES